MLIYLKCSVQNDTFVVHCFEYYNMVVGKWRCRVMLCGLRLGAWFRKILYSRICSPPGLTFNEPTEKNKIIIFEFHWLLIVADIYHIFQVQDDMKIIVRNLQLVGKVVHRWRNILKKLHKDHIEDDDSALFCYHYF